MSTEDPSWPTARRLELHIYARRSRPASEVTWKVTRLLSDGSEEHDTAVIQYERLVHQITLIRQ